MSKKDNKIRVESSLKVLNYFTNEMGLNTEVSNLMFLSVARILLKDIEKNNTFINLEEKLASNEVRHISDWLKVAVNNNEEWLHNIDDRSRPKKLMKFSSIEQMVKEADKAMAIANQKLKTSYVPSNEGEEVIWHLEDGYTIVRLLTPEALDRESAQMQHCIGNGAYDDFLDEEDSTVLFLSLRDPYGKPHATMEVEINSILQLQGKQNTTPDPKYIALLRPWLKEADLKSLLKYDKKLLLSEDNNIFHAGEISNIKGFVLNANNADKTISTKEFAGYELPEDLKALGNLYEMRDNGILPKGLYVEESLYYPENISENTTIKGNLLGAATIKHIGDNLRVEGSCDLTKSYLKALPKYFFVGNNLNISHNDGIFELPEGLICRKITANNSQLEDISRVSRELELLNINSSAVKNIPEDMVIDSLLAGNLVFERMPKKLTVKNVLNLCGSHIPDIYDNWNISGHINFSKTKIERMHGDFVFYSDSTVDFKSATIEQMPNSITSLNRSITFNKAKINSLPEILFAKSYIDLRHIENLESLLDDCKELKCRRLILSEMLVIPDQWDVESVEVSDNQEFGTIYPIDEYRSLIANNQSLGL